MASALEEFTDCPICCEPFLDPQKLTCDHTICKRCLNRLKSKRRVTCPKCRAVCGISEVKPDFKHGQFLDAFAKQAEILTGTSVEHRHSANEKHLCNLCNERPFTCLCEECNHWLCEKCEGMHKKIPATKDHSIKSLSHCINDAREKMNGELNSLGNKAAQYASAIKTTQDVAEKAKNDKALKLEDSNEMRNIFLGEVNDLFDSFDAKIIKAMDGCVKKAKKQQSIFENAVKGIETLNLKIEKYMKEGGPQLVLERNELILQIKDLTESSIDQNPSVSVPNIHITRKMSAKNAATLTLEEGKKQAYDSSYTSLREQWKKQSDQYETMGRFNPFRMSASPMPDRNPSEALEKQSDQYVNMYRFNPFRMSDQYVNMYRFNPFRMSASPMPDRNPSEALEKQSDQNETTGKFESSDK